MELFMNTDHLKTHAEHLRNIFLWIMLRTVYLRSLCYISIDIVLQDGVHQEKEETEPVHTEAELKLMFSQDQKYVTMKRTSELNVEHLCFLFICILHSYRRNELRSNVLNTVTLISFASELVWQFEFWFEVICLSRFSN